MPCGKRAIWPFALLISPNLRLQELTERDLQKQEREKSANSLEAFIFETQVRVEDGSEQPGPPAKPD